MSDFEPYVESDWENAYRISEQERHDARVNWEGRFRPDPKPAKRVKRSKAPKPDESWKLAVLDRDQGCCVHASPHLCEPPFVAHHVLYQQHIRNDGVTAILWDTAVGMGVCELAHRQHHSRVRPIFRDEIPADVAEFLERLGYGWYLDSKYPLRHSDDGDVTQAAA